MADNIKAAQAADERGTTIWFCLYCHDYLIDDETCQKPPCLWAHNQARRRMGLPPQVPQLGPANSEAPFGCYRCSCCGAVYARTIPNEIAIAEGQQHFPGAELEEVCTDCYDAIVAHAAFSSGDRPPGAASDGGHLTS